MSTMSSAVRGTRSSRPKVFLGESEVRAPASPGRGEWVERDGERYFKIANYHAMPPFLMTVVSAYDHWLFVSSTGGLTCGRRNPDIALFPYVTDDKIHDAAATTGPRTALLVEQDGKTWLWQPFDAASGVYDVERNLYKNEAGNRIVFEEVNHRLGLVFAYAWTTGKRFGFIRSSQLINVGASEVRVRLLDGLRNLLPYGIDRTAQAEFSTLIDAYKQAERVAGVCAGLHTLTAAVTDRPEPSEVLKATVVWSTGLEPARVLLSERQVPAFCLGEEVQDEAIVRGQRGAFFVHAAAALAPGSVRTWYLLADVEQGPSQLAALLRAVRRGVDAEDIERDAAAGTARLQRLVGGADGFQMTADARVTGRHFSNTLFNIMRGGTFPHAYRFPVDDFLCFVGERNRPLKHAVESAVGALPDPLTLESAARLAEDGPNGAVSRLVREYLPLTFSRRHGDPSRPWNDFSITLENGNGAEYSHYEGNWRDIFQNWEALAVSFPEYLESFVAKFVNASTADGYNAYRISRAGIDWDVLDPEHPWSNIGYWGDHQVAYLCRFVERSRDYHPGALERWLARDEFVYADVPYRIRPYRQLLRNPKDSVEFDHEHARTIAGRVAELGADGKLLPAADGSIYRVNLLEKLLVPALVKIGNFSPDGGIWMNTQRPEWNDANNALVGYGLSMVTACHLRRYLLVLRALLRDGTAARFEVSVGVARFLRETGAVLEDHAAMLAGPIGAVGRKSFMDRMGSAGDAYRDWVYRGVLGERTAIRTRELEDFVGRSLAFLDHAIVQARRDDGLFQAYNLIRFEADGYPVEPLDEMLEGQVAVLSSGCLDGRAALALLESLRASRLYREDRNSYVLYPDRAPVSFLDKNVLPPSVVQGSDWIRRQLEAGRAEYVERDVDGRVHFQAGFRNASDLRDALERDPDVQPEEVSYVCDAFETVFRHRTFTGRSGSMSKYEGLGCIYWHMVSKLLVATTETIDRAVRDGADPSLIDRLAARFRDIRDGLGVQDAPARYGAFPIDPYSHTPKFAGAQQPGLTGQVKEDLLTRFWQLGVRVARGEIAFEPIVLERAEFLRHPASWSFSTGGPLRTEELAAGSLAFTVCGVPVVYRIAEAARVRVYRDDDAPIVIEGTRLGPELSRSLFRREQRIKKVLVDVPGNALR